MLAYCIKYSIMQAMPSAAMSHHASGCHCPYIGIAHTIQLRVTIAM